MKLFQFILFITLLFIGNVGICQTVEGYDFKNYKPKTVSVKQKAKINYSSNATARTYRTRISQGYKNGKIDFAGHYITTIWGCGTGCINGAMTDLQNGNVYDLPLGETTYYYGCELPNDADYANYNSQSRLFVTMMCSETETTFEKTYFINVWDEVKKEFTLLEKITRSVSK